MVPPLPPSLPTVHNTHQHSGHQQQKPDNGEATKTTPKKKTTKLKFLSMSVTPYRINAGHTIVNIVQKKGKATWWWQLQPKHVASVCEASNKQVYLYWQGHSVQRNTKYMSSWLLVLKRYTEVPINSFPVPPWEIWKQLVPSICLSLHLCRIVWKLIHVQTACYIATEVQKLMSLVMSYVTPLTVHILPLGTSRYFFKLRHFIMSYVTGPDLPYSSILFHKMQ